MKRKELKSWAVLILFAFLFNLIWENAHSLFYTHYKGMEITQLHLLRAAFVDASIIFVIGFIIHKLPLYFNYQLLAIFIAGVFVAIGIEVWALEVGRWSYNSWMPIIPVLKTGLTPTVQLGILGILSYSFAFKKFK